VLPALRFPMTNPGGGLDAPPTLSRLDRDRGAFAPSPEPHDQGHFIAPWTLDQPSAGWMPPTCRRWITTELSRCPGAASTGALSGLPDRAETSAFPLYPHRPTRRRLDARAFGEFGPIFDAHTLAALSGMLSPRRKPLTRRAARMTEVKVAHIFLDTNTALHFQRPDQIDWCGLTGCDEAVLVGAPILHRELEKQKIHNPSGKLRKRAAAYIKWLVEFVRDPAREVRSGTTWHFIPVEPQIDFREHSLSPDNADDNLLASVISYAPPGDPKVYVATADHGLEIKLWHRQITPLLLPDAAKVPDEPDAQEKELHDLRRKVAERHLPNLVLVTEGHGNRHPFKVGAQGTASSAISPEEMRRKYPPMHGPEALPSEKKAALSPEVRYDILCATMCGLPQDIEAYNKEREEFFAKYDEYFSNLLQWEEHAALTVAVELTLSNDGTPPTSMSFCTFQTIFLCSKRTIFPSVPKSPSRLVARTRCRTSPRSLGSVHLACCGHRWPIFQM
jgi:hypothetical protein